MLYHHHHRFNHQVPLSASTLPLLSQVFTIWERRQFESIPIQLEGFPNTHPIHLINGFLGSPLVQLKNRGSAQPLTLRESTPPGGQSHLGLTPMAPRTSLLPPGCAVSLFGSRPELSYSASRSERVIQPTK